MCTKQSGFVYRKTSVNVNFQSEIWHEVGLVAECNPLLTKRDNVKKKFNLHNKPLLPRFNNCYRRSDIIESCFKSFKLYSFYNNNIWLQIGQGVILLGGELIRNMFGQVKPLEFLPWIKSPILLMPAVGFIPRPPSNSVVVRLG